MQSEAPNNAQTQKGGRGSAGFTTASGVQKAGIIAHLCQANTLIALIQHCFCGNRHKQVYTYNRWSNKEFSVSTPSAQQAQSGDEQITSTSLLAHSTKCMHGHSISVIYRSFASTEASTNTASGPQGLDCLACTNVTTCTEQAPEAHNN